MIALSIKEEAFGTGNTHILNVPLLSYHLTLENLIEAKVKAKVLAINSGLGTKEMPSNFVSQTEKKLNRPMLQKKNTKHRATLKALQLDGEKAAYEALDGFQRNAFFVIIDGEQKTELKEELQLTSDSKVHFVRLLPLIGG